MKLFVLTRMFDIRSSEFNNCRSSESNWRRSPTTSGCRYPAGTEIRPPADQIPAGILLDSGQAGRLWPKRLGSNRIWTDPAIDPARSGQNGQDPAGYDPICPDPEDSGRI